MKKLILTAIVFLTLLISLKGQTIQTEQEVIFENTVAKISSVK